MREIAYLAEPVSVPLICLLSHFLDMGEGKRGGAEWPFRSAGRTAMIVAAGWSARPRIVEWQK